MTRAIRWPKPPSDLTPEERSINEEWNRYWFEINRDRHTRTIDFGHEYVAKRSPRGFVTTLDVGAGLGEQLRYEELTPEQLRNYVALESSPAMVEGLRARYPEVRVVSEGFTERLPFDDAYFDRILAVHVLEHLRDLPRFLDEAARVLKPSGRLMMVIPCEGSLAYSLGRRVTSQRMFEKRYRRPYKRFIRDEHVNQAWEILVEVRKRFRVEHQEWFPLRVPLIHLNLVAAMTLTVR